MPAPSFDHHALKGRVAVDGGFLKASLSNLYNPPEPGRNDTRAAGSTR
jgi:hypothetical protein